MSRRKSDGKIEQGPKRELSANELADELDLHRQTIVEYDRRGAPREKAGRGYHYNAGEYLAWMKANGVSGLQGRQIEGDSPDLAAAKLRKENALAARYELQVAREKGELVPALEVKQWIGENVTTARNKLLGMGAQLTPLLEGREAAERQTLIEERVTEILNELAAA